VTRWPATSVWASALAIGAFQVIGSFGAADNQPHRNGIDALALALVLLGPLALARRDRWPVLAVGVAAAAADVYVGLGYPYGPVFVSVVVALFIAVQAGRRRATCLLAAAGFVGFVVASFVDPRAEGDPGAVHLALVAGWLAVVLAVSELVRSRRDQVAQQERAEAEEAQRRAGEQRLVLAQELHDVLAHNISLVNVQASVALHLIDEQPDQARAALTNIKEASRDALGELRAALDLLRHDRETAPRAPAPGLADLASLVAGVRAGGLEVHLDQGDAPSSLTTAVELAAYRIVQEALTNVTRHARARAVTVRLSYEDGVSIDVTDDGVGGPAVAGNGISGMRERASALGGTLEVGLRPGGGFRVRAHLPVGRP
jgi:signal transduction histidine kinase